MNKKFDFDFAKLSFEDQKFLYQHFDVECFEPEQLEKASNLSELQACFDEEGNTAVEKLAFFAALLAHDIAVIKEIPKEFEGKPYTLTDVHFRGDIAYDFDGTDYDGLNYDGKGLISLMDTIECYQLNSLRDLFKKYQFVVELA